MDGYCCAQPCTWGRRSGAGEILSTRNFMARPRTCPGSCTSILNIGWLVTRMWTIYHPLFLYESLWNLGNMFLLLWLSRRFADRLKNGRSFPGLPDRLSRWALSAGLFAARCLAGRRHQHQPDRYGGCCCAGSLGFALATSPQFLSGSGTRGITGTVV